MRERLFINIILVIGIAAIVIFGGSTAKINEIGAWSSEADIRGRNEKISQAPIFGVSLKEKIQENEKEELEEGIGGELEQEEEALIVEEKAPLSGKSLDVSWVAASPLSCKIRYTQYYHAGHRAVDIGKCREQSAGAKNIFSVAEGVVSAVTWDNVHGNRVEIAHNNGWKTTYSHLLRAMAQKGDAATRGQLIGVMGSTGVSTGPHLHLEFIDPQGRKTNPQWHLQGL